MYQTFYVLSGSRWHSERNREWTRKSTLPLFLSLCYVNKQTNQERVLEDNDVLCGQGQRERERKLSCCTNGKESWRIIIYISTAYCKKRSFYSSNPLSANIAVFNRMNIAINSCTYAVILYVHCTNIFLLRKEPYKLLFGVYLTSSIEWQDAFGIYGSAGGLVWCH